MQVILLEKVANLGQLGDVVKVKPGYARNYLIPQGKAKRATHGGNLAEFEKRRAELEKAQNQNLRHRGRARREAGGLCGAGRAESRRRRAAVRLGDQLRHRRSAARRRASKCRKRRCACRTGRSSTSANMRLRWICTPT